MMALTRVFKDTIKARVEGDPASRNFQSTRLRRLTAMNKRERWVTGVRLLR